jgi:hypothetical protein
LTSQYSALHSAVFHGRFTNTIELILRAEAETRVSPNAPKVCLLQNTQGEIPLHFCAMRGEGPRSVALIVNAAPQAVLKRDTSGLTPFHWLWIRFVSTLLTLEGGGRGTDATIAIAFVRQSSISTTPFNEFAVMEQGDVDADLRLIKKMDPSVDYLHMRHIPLQVLDDAECLRRATRAASVLGRIRERHYQHLGLENHDDISIQWTREEAVIALFWTKTVSLLEAANIAAKTPLYGDSILLHTAFTSKCCMASVALLAASLFPDELTARDSRGRLPVHCAASRPWHRQDWPSEDDLNEQTAAKLLHLDSLAVFRVALTLSPPEAFRVADSDNRLVLHHLIATLVQASTFLTRSMPIHRKESVMSEVLDVLKRVVEMYPDALHQRDGATELYPFLQVTAMASEYEIACDDVPLSMTYMLLRENPTILGQIK